MGARASTRAILAGLTGFRMVVACLLILFTASPVSSVTMIHEEVRSSGCEMELFVCDTA